MAQNRPQGAREAEYRYQYAAKLICTAHIIGTSQTSSAVLPGTYRTAVNIHNPDSETARYRVKLVVAEPSRFIQGHLGPNHGTRWDCDRVTVSFGPFIHGVEGFLVIESTHSLDVVAVYTAGHLGDQVESIDVEQIPERRISKKPDGRFRLDHFKVYEVERVEVDHDVRLTDQLSERPKVAHLHSLTHFANPTRKVHHGAQIGVRDARRHLNWYEVEQEEPEPRRTVRFRNQFGDHSVDIGDPRFLLVPCQKISDKESDFPELLDHYKCYQVVEVNTAPDLPAVMLGDQFGSQENVELGEPRLFCLPVRKETEAGDAQEIRNPEDHLAVYEISPQGHDLEITTRDQFGERPLQVLRSAWLAVPSEKQVVATHDE